MADSEVRQKFASNDEVMRITEKLSNFLSNEIAAMTRDERLFAPRDMENAVYQGIRAAYEAGEIAMKEKAAAVCERGISPHIGCLANSPEGNQCVPSGGTCHVAMALAIRALPLSGRKKLKSERWVTTEEEGFMYCFTDKDTEAIEANLADYAKRYFGLFDQYRGAWLREMGGVIRPKRWEIDGFVLRMRDIYEKAQLVDRMKQIMVQELNKKSSAEQMFDEVFKMLAEDGNDKIPTN